MTGTMTVYQDDREITSKPFISLDHLRSMVKHYELIAELTIDQLTIIIKQNEES